MKKEWKNVGVLAMDIDGTLTTSGVFTSDVLRALSQLNSAGLKLILVTGRPSGWVQGLSSYLPVHAAIAENGGVVFPSRESLPFFRHAQTGQYLPADGTDQRAPLEQTFRKLKVEHPDLRVTEDNIYRLSDFTFHVAGLSQEKLQDFREQVETAGLSFTWSTIHAHIMPRGQNKGSALRWLLEKLGFQTSPAISTLTVGDSPNDAPLFEEIEFPLSAGVANIMKYRRTMSAFPKYITTLQEGRGFVEIADELLELKGDCK